MFDRLFCKFMVGFSNLFEGFVEVAWAHFGINVGLVVCRSSEFVCFSVDSRIAFGMVFKDFCWS